jgi:hypothetical protein
MRVHLAVLAAPLSPPGSALKPRAGSGTLAAQGANTRLISPHVRGGGFGMPETGSRGKRFAAILCPSSWQAPDFAVEDHTQEWRDAPSEGRDRRERSNGGSPVGPV